MQKTGSKFETGPASVSRPFGRLLQFLVVEVPHFEVLEIVVVAHDEFPGFEVVPVGESQHILKLILHGVTPDLWCLCSHWNWPPYPNSKHFPQSVNLFSKQISIVFGYIYEKSRRKKWLHRPHGDHHYLSYFTCYYCRGRF